MLVVKCLFEHLVYCQGHLSSRKAVSTEIQHISPTVQLIQRPEKVSQVTKVNLYSTLL